MALPEIIKDIEARVKDTGDIMTGKLTILTNNKTVTFGCDNTQMAHYYTDAANGHWFNTNLYVEGNIYAGTNYSDLVLTAENFNNYTPTLTGTGASGTWNINITGKSDYADYIIRQDTRNINQTPLEMLNGLSVHLKSKGADGLEDGDGYHPSIHVRDWQDYSGGPWGQIAMTLNQNLWFRVSTSGTTWGSWKKVLDSSNYTTYLNNYLPLTGGTMTGQIKFNKSGSSWIGVIEVPEVNYIYADHSSSTSSVYHSMIALRYANHTLSLGGERASEQFGIYAYNNSRTVNGYDAGFYVASDLNFYCSTKLYGAVWNDYAEYRQTIKNIKPGMVVIEQGDGSMKPSTDRLQPGGNIVSDTFGFAIGETDECKTPLAVSGRALAYPAEDRYSYEPGDAVGTGPNGTVSKMTREEIMMYPERIIGTVSEIPEYERWGTGNVLIDGRIWIKVK